jgi:hypothetical protein
MIRIHGQTQALFCETRMDPDRQLDAIIGNSIPTGEANFLRPHRTRLSLLPERPRTCG